MSVSELLEEQSLQERVGKSEFRSLAHLAEIFGNNILQHRSNSHSDSKNKQITNLLMIGWGAESWGG